MGSHPYQLRLITLCKLHTQMVATLDWRIFPVDALDHCLIIWPAEKDLQRKGLPVTIPAFLTTQAPSPHSFDFRRYCQLCARDEALSGKRLPSSA